MKLLGLEISKKVFIGIIVGIVAVGGVTTGVILMNNNKDNQKQEEKQKDTILLKEDLKFEINSEVNLLSMVSEENKVKVLSEDEKIDTSTLGEKEITIKYEMEEKEETKTFKITIIDTQAPTIEYKKELSTTEGTKIDLLKDVKVNDNSKEEIKATIEGDYNFDKEGTYNLKYVATDSSNNKIEEEFTLKVNKKTTTSSNKPNNSSNKPQTNNNSNNNSNNTQNTTSNNKDADYYKTIYDKYYNMYKNKYTTKIESFSPEQYVTIKTAPYPYKWHYEWWLPTQKWVLVSDSNFPVKDDVAKLYPAPSRDGKEITYEENGITHYTGEKTQVYQAYGYSVQVVVPGVCSYT